MDVEMGTSVKSTLGDVPEDPSMILTSLQEEGAPIRDYLEYALRYHETGDELSFKRMIQAGSDSVRGKSIYEGQNREHIALIATLTGHYLGLAAGSVRDPKKLYNLFEEATGLINEADQIEPGHDAIFLCKGVLSLLRMTPENKDELLRLASQHFAYALEKNPVCIPALLGQAWIAYESVSFMDALQLYQRVLRLWVDCPPSVRLGLGLCLFRLGHDVYALECFQRVLEMEPSNLVALTCVAVIQLNLGRDDTSFIGEGLNKFKLIYKQDKTNPHALLHLGQHFFSRGEFSKAEALAMGLFYAASSAGPASTHFSGRIKADAAYLLGKVYHAQDNYDDAFRYYLQATKYDSGFLPAQFTLAQMHVHRKELDAAILLLEAILHRQPHCLEALKMLSTIYTTQEKRNDKKAAQYLATLVSVFPEDIEGLVAYVTFIEQTNHLEALKVYGSILAKLQRAGIMPPVEIANNAAVLLLDQGKPTEALNLFKQSLDSDTSSDPSLRKILMFNYGRSLEALKRYDEATEAYESVLALDPNYTDASLRLGIIMSAQGRGDAAADLFKDLVAANQSCKEAWILLAQHQLSTKAVTPARKTLERILTAVDKHDMYALLSLGNLYMTLARNDIIRHALPATIQGNIAHSMEFFNKCYLLDSKNYYALNGLAVLAALKGHVKEAREAFLHIRQVVPEFLDVWLNLAHGYVQEKRFSAALNLYEHVEKHTSSPGPVYAYLAKTLYGLAKSNQQSSLLQRAISYLEKALELQPGDGTLSFNMALCQQEYAVIVLASNLSTRAVTDVVTAMEYLDASAAGFDSLAEAVPSSQGAQLGYDPKLARSRSNYCHSLRASALQQYKKHREEELTKQSAIEKMTLERQQRERDDEEKRLRKEELDRLENDARETLYQQNREKALEVMSVNSGGVDKDADADDSENEGKSKTKKRRGKRQRPKTAVVLSDSASDGEPGAPVEEDAIEELFEDAGGSPALGASAHEAAESVGLDADASATINPGSDSVMDDYVDFQGDGTN